MRKIKFRGRSQYDGHWVYGYLIGDDLIAGGIKVKYPLEIWNDIRELDKWEEVDPETVGQYTGLKDKNGVDIYEGDVLSVQEVTECKEVGRGNIEWFEGLWYVNVEHDSLNELNRAYYLEVIGNIHENPELLEDQQ